MSNSDEYRRNAANCLREGDRTTDTRARLLLMEMAHAWHRLADQAERNGKADIVYEPPLSRAEPQPMQQQQQVQPDRAEPDNNQ